MSSRIKMKKRHKWILLGLICLTGITILVLCLNKNAMNKLFHKSLAGNKIASGLYKYDFISKNSVNSVTIRDDKVYYLVSNEYTYKLYELSIWTNESKFIDEVKSDVCLLNNDYITCYNGAATIVYDFNFKKIYSSEEGFNIVPYQDSYLIIEEKDIYFNNKKIRTIRDDIENFDIINYYTTTNNTYIIFIFINDLYLYDVKEDVYTKLDTNEVYLYENGYYYGTKDKIVIKNLDNGSTKEYDNFKKDENLSFSAVRDNLYFHMDKKYLKIYNLETNKFKYINHGFKKSVDQVILKGDYLYLTFQGDNPELYVVKIDEIDSKEMTIDEYNKIQANKVKTRVEELEKKYTGLEIVYDTKDYEEIQKWSEKLVDETSYEYLYEALDAIDTVFSKLGNDFIGLFKHDEYKGIRIIITEQIITGSDYKISNLAGLSFPNYTHYNMIISQNGMPYEKVLCHEMMHTIDSNALNLKYDIGGNWYDYNPKGFEYNINNYNDDNAEYTTYSYSDDDVYFVDSYAKVNQSEDRARTFENICYVDGENIIKKYPNLLKKAEYIRDELLKYYPSLKNSTIFDSIQ